MACCHGLTLLKGKIIGDPLDVKVFETTNYTIQDEEEIGFECIHCIHSRNHPSKRFLDLKTRNSEKVRVLQQNVTNVSHSLTERRNSNLLKRFS